MKLQLRQTYPVDKLFTVSCDHNTADAMDIKANSGDLVAVLVQKDPMGNKERWFVDNGGELLFILSDFVVYFIEFLFHLIYYHFNSISDSLMC